MSMNQDIFVQARASFGNSVYGHWDTIIGNSEWLLWDVFNVKYGPLNYSQRGYAVKVIRQALVECVQGDRPIGLFLYLLRKLANDEVVDEHMKKYRDVQEMAGVEDLVS